MKKFSNIITESLLDDEEELVNSEDLTDIPYTGIKYIDRKIDENEFKDEISCHIR